MSFVAYAIAFIFVESINKCFVLIKQMHVIICNEIVAHDSKPIICMPVLLYQ